jgi:Ca2+-binding EF-hand superfamily protein
MDTLDVTRVLKQDSLDRLQNIFERMADSSGRLSAKSLKAIFDMMGANYTLSDVMDLVVEMDPRNRAIDFTDFVAIMTRPLDDNVLDDLKDAFSVLDRQKRGYVDAEDVRAVMAEVVNTQVSLLTVGAGTCGATARRMSQTLPDLLRLTSAHPLHRASVLSQAKEMVAEFCDAHGDGQDAQLRLDEFMRVMVQK